MCTVDRSVGQKLHWWLPRAEESGGNRKWSLWLLMDSGFLSDVLMRSKIDCGDGYPTLNIPKTTELYTLNGWPVWYVNYIPINLLKNNLRMKAAGLGDFKVQL